MTMNPFAGAPLCLLLLLGSLAPAGEAKWITSADVASRRSDPTSKPANDPLTNTWTCFRRTFSLDAVPTSVPVKIAADSRYWLWVNGKLIVWEGSLKRGPTRTDSYIDTVELS